MPQEDTQKGSAKIGVDSEVARNKRKNRLTTIRGVKRKSLVEDRRRDFCPAANALYGRYGEEKAKGKGAVAAWRDELIKAYQDCKTINFDNCNPSEVGDLIDILADMKIEQETASGEGKMVGGNPILHFARLQKWLTPKLAWGAAAISDCAKWFINKILDELTVIGGATVALGGMTWSGLIDLTKYAMGADDTQTAQMILAICDGIGQVANTTGDTLSAIGTAAYRSSAYSTVFTDHIHNLLTTQKNLFLGKIPGVNTSAEFDAWLRTLTRRDVMSAVATMIAAGKWGAVVFGTAKLTFGILLTTGYYGILAAAWSMDGYVLTGAWLTYYGYNSLDDESLIKQRVVDVKQGVVNALKYIDNVIAGKIEVKDMAMEQVAVLKTEPKARALVLARLDNKMVEAEVKLAEATAGLTHEQAVKKKLEKLGVLFEETDRIAAVALDTQMGNRIMEARLENRALDITATNVDFNPIADLPQAVTIVLAAGRGAAGASAAVASAAGASAASQGFGTHSAPTVAQPKMDQSGSESDLGEGGKRATRKRGKRSSKRAPRKTKTTRKKTTRKKRRGKK